ncbi:MAG: tetratricopeptide repeat protein, partial [Ignavibacteria bacterium]|nr:tetratricopeptide repeat protein [Ignavibacteria bacterium]
YEKLENEAILQNLAEINLNNIYEILDCYICGPNSLSRFIGNNTINSVIKPNFRLSVNSTSYNMVDLRPYLRLFKEVKEPVLYLLKDVESSLEGADIVRAILNMFYKSSNYIFEGLLYEFDRDLQNALQTFRLAYQTNKLDYGAKRFLDAYYDLQLINEPKTAVELTENAKILYQKMEYQKAVDVLKEALKVDSRYAPAYFGLGINYEIMNDVQMAKQMYRRTLRLKPPLKPAEERLNKILTQEKEFEDQFRRGIFNKSN